MGEGIHPKALGLTRPATAQDLDKFAGTRVVRNGLVTIDRVTDWLVGRVNTERASA